MQFKRLVALLALAAGFVGIPVCIVGAFAAWSLGSRLERTNATVFAMIDKGLTAAQDRVRSVQERVEESKITGTELEQVPRLGSEEGKRKPSYRGSRSKVVRKSCPGASRLRTRGSRQLPSRFEASSKFWSWAIPSAPRWILPQFKRRLIASCRCGTRCRRPNERLTKSVSLRPTRRVNRKKCDFRGLPSCWVASW